MLSTEGATEPPLKRYEPTNPYNLTDEEFAQKEELVERYQRIYPNIDKTHLGWLYDHIVRMTDKELEEERERIETTVMKADTGGVIDSSIMLAGWEEKYSHLIKQTNAEEEEDASGSETCERDDSVESELVP